MANFYKKLPSTDDAASIRAGEKKNQLGRSMIEMLGVLAIIAVLSVGGIAGYSRAMEQYNWNKALDQWNSLIGLMYRYKSQLLHVNDGSTGEFPLIPILSGFSELPSEMIIPGNNNQLKDAMGTILNIYNHDTGYIGIASFNKEENNAACRLMLTIGQYHHAIIDYLKIYNNAGGDNVFLGDSWCCKNCKNCLKDLLISQIATACKNNPVCTNSNQCRYLLYWY